MLFPNCNVFPLTKDVLLKLRIYLAETPENSDCDIVKKHKVQYMLYADDGYIYVCFKPTDADVTRIQMETLTADLNDWFIDNNLMSNNDKLVTLLINGPCGKTIIFPLLSRLTV